MPPKIKIKVKKSSTGEEKSEEPPKSKKLKIKVKKSSTGEEKSEEPPKKPKSKTKKILDKTKQKLKRVEKDLVETKEELAECKEVEQMSKEELRQLRQQYNQTKKDLNDCLKNKGSKKEQTILEARLKDLQKRIDKGVKQLEAIQRKVPKKIKNVAPLSQPKTKPLLEIINDVNRELFKMKLEDFPKNKKQTGEDYSDSGRVQAYYLSRYREELKKYYRLDKSGPRVKRDYVYKDEIDMITKKQKMVWSSEKNNRFRFWEVEKHVDYPNPFIIRKIFPPFSFDLEGRNEEIRNNMIAKLKRIAGDKSDWIWESERRSHIYYSIGENANHKGKLFFENIPDEIGAEETKGGDTDEEEEEDEQEGDGLVLKLECATIRNKKYHYDPKSKLVFKYHNVNAPGNKIIGKLSKTNKSVEMF